LAGKQHLAVAAVLGQGLEFILPELALLFRDRQFEHGRFFDVSEQVVGLHVVVAGIKVSVEPKIGDVRAERA